MLAAIDTAREVAVTGQEVYENDSYAECLTKEKKESPQQISTSEARFRCLCCDEPLVYRGIEAATPIEWFAHKHGGCVSDGNMSMAHRLGQEMTARALFNLLPTGRGATQIDLERRIGTGSGFVIADVRVFEPIQLAVEVVNLSTELNLRRRLETLFELGYAGMIIVVTTGELSATQLERHLSKVGTIRIGRFDSRTLTLEFGSVVTPDVVDLETPVWNSVPAYLS